MFFIIEILCTLLEIFIFLYVIADLIFAARDSKYQKKWDKEKAMLIQIDPNITRAELCEKYVIFRKKNCCNVEF